MSYRSRNSVFNLHPRFSFGSAGGIAAAVITPTFSGNFTTSMPAAFSFSRASSATYTDSSGIQRSATTNTPRFDYNPVTLQPRGLLLEDTRTNSCLQSKDFSQAVWGKFASTYSASATLAPDGTTFMARITQSTANSNHNVNQSFGAPVVGTNYINSVTLKYDGTTQWIQIMGWVGSGTAWANFDILNGVTGFSSTSPVSRPYMQNLGNGFWRCSVGYTGAVASGNLSIQVNHLQANTNSNNPGFTGDGTSAFLITDGQQEIGLFPSSVIPTVASAATRAVDVTTAPVASIGFTSGNVGSIVVGFQLEDVLSSGTGARQIYTLRSTASTEVDSIYFRTSGTNTNLGSPSINSGGVGQPTSGWTTFTLASFTPTKIGLAYAPNDMATVKDGSTVTTSTAATMVTATPTTVTLGVSGVSAEALFGWITKFDYYNTRIPDATLQSLTV